MTAHLKAAENKVIAESSSLKNMFAFLVMSLNFKRHPSLPSGDTVQEKTSVKRLSSALIVCSY